MTETQGQDSKYRIGWRPFIPRLLGAVLIYLVGSVLTLLWGPDWAFSAWCCAFLVLFILSLRTQQNRQLAAHLAVVELVRAGQFEEAATQLDTFCANPASIPAHMMLIYSRAVVFQCMGDFDRALTLYRTVLDATGWGAKRVMRVYGDLYFAGVAEAYAWAGELEQSRELLDRAKEAASDDNEVTVLPEAIMALRGGDAAKALNLLDAGWEALESARHGYEMSPVHLVYLEALKALGRAGSTEWQTHAKALTPEALAITAWAGGRWPEMAETLKGLRADE